MLRTAIAKTLVKQDTACVEVGTLIRAAAAHDLGWDEARRAHHQTGPRQRLGVRGSRYAEIGQPGPSVGTDQHVGRLYVAVDDPSGVHVRQGTHQLPEDGLRVPVCAMVRPQPVGQRPSRDVFHHQVRAGLAGAEIEHVDEVWMRQPGGDERLALKAGDVGGVERERVGQHLDGHRPAEPGVVGEPDGRHASSAQNLPQAVAAASERGSQGHFSHCHLCLPPDRGRGAWRERVGRALVRRGPASAREREWARLW